MWHSRPLRDPPPFMANAILNFHFDFLNPSLIELSWKAKKKTKMLTVLSKRSNFQVLMLYKLPPWSRNRNRQTIQGQRCSRFPLVCKHSMVQKKAMKATPMRLRGARSCLNSFIFWMLQSWNVTMLAENLIWRAFLADDFRVHFDVFLLQQSGPPQYWKSIRREEEWKRWHKTYHLPF